MTEDTNVLIICLSVYNLISGNMYIQCGTKTDFITLTLLKLGSLSVKRLVKLYKGFMHLQAVTQSAPLVVEEKSVLLSLL